MDVQCERCKTEYEFDDALVSGRGTTVRCTNCGHQFKVRRSAPDGAGTGSAGDGDARDALNDRWVVHTARGNELTFLTLRELQRAILVQQVGRGDMLVRGTSQPRTLGSIAELEPFFDGRASSRPPPPSNAVASAIALRGHRRSQADGVVGSCPTAEPLARASSAAEDRHPSAPAHGRGSAAASGCTLLAPTLSVRLRSHRPRRSPAGAGYAPWLRLRR